MSSNAVCVLCGQPLEDPTVLARYQHNVEKHELELLQRGEQQARKAVEAEYAAKEQERLTLLTQQAEEAAEKKYAAQRQVLAQAVKTQQEQLVQRAKAEQERTKAHQEEIDALNRKLEGLSSADRGAIKEQELQRALAQEFPDDKIDLHKNGQPGGDIFHEVRYRSGEILASAGFIVYECKDALHWNNAWVTQTKESQHLLHANHAILVSRALPRNQQGFVMQDDVAVVEAHCMVSIAQVLREGMIAAARAGLSVDGQAAKTAALYQYLSGDEFPLTFKSLTEATTRLHESLLKEQRDHSKDWAQRSVNYKKIDQSMAIIQENIASIIERPDDENADRNVVRLDPAEIAVQDFMKPPRAALERTFGGEMKLTVAQQATVAELFGCQPLPPGPWVLKAVPAWHMTDDDGEKISGSGYSFHDEHDGPLPFPGVGSPAPEAFVFKVAGVSHRPAELQNDAFQPGRHLTLIPEPENIQDANAVAVWDDAQKLQLGYVPREMAEDVAVALRQGHKREAICLWQWRKDGNRVGVEAFVAPSLGSLKII